MPKTVKDLQALTGLGEELVRAAILAGELPGYYVGKRVTIPDEAFERFSRGEWIPRPRRILADPVQPAALLVKRQRRLAPEGAP